MNWLKIVRLGAIPTLLCAAIIFAASNTTAAPSKTFGIRAGFGLDPDQIAFGLQSRSGELLPNVRFAPSIDVGFGDNLTVFSANGDLLVPLAPPDSRSAFFLGGGPTLSYIDPKVGDGDTELGISLVAGLKLPFGNSHNWTLEGRYGIGDIPEVRVMIGILFGSQARIGDE